jgi:hypothetical protein
VKDFFWLFDDLHDGTVYYTNNSQLNGCHEQTWLDLVDH